MLPQRRVIDPFYTVAVFLFKLQKLVLRKIDTTSEKFENGVFPLKTHQIFPVHTTTEEF